MSNDLRRMGSWGRLSHDVHRVSALHDRCSAIDAVCAASAPAIPFGNGRSYGDVCLNPQGLVWSTRRLDRFISFDNVGGTVECESGALLGEILDLVVPHRWFLPVVPGTQFATLGGAIANDVHGKGHHRTGSFGNHLLSLELLRTDGTKLHCGANANVAWFDATIGGLGLTGVILSAKLRLEPIPGPWLVEETIPFDLVEDFFNLSRGSSADWAYTVAWIDCSNRNGRGIFFRANRAPRVDDARRVPRFAVPFAVPFSLVNRYSVPIFNAAYFRRHRRRAGRREVHYRNFFFTLDSLEHWNRMYGPRGFYQYQCVVPQRVEVDAMKELVEVIAESHAGSVLVVLKSFGTIESRGLLSFPMPGTTLAIDFPNQGGRTLKLLSRLDEVVCSAGGRLYPAKDARMSADTFARGYPRLEEFRAYRDPGISSAMSRRLLGA